MRIVIVSDTHGKFAQLDIPDGDILIHCGDMTVRGDMGMLERFGKELEAKPHTHKVVVAGNHDSPFETDRKRAEALLPSAVYLQDELVELGGLRIYGSPWQPEFRKMAFNKPRSSEALKAVWDSIPDHLDILVTHGPPRGILDRTPYYPSVGDEFLLERVLQVKPKLHCFGHVHLSRGILERDGIIFANAASLDEKYNPKNEPLVIDL